MNIIRKVIQIVPQVKPSLLINAENKQLLDITSSLTSRLSCLNIQGKKHLLMCSFYFFSSQLTMS